MTAGLSGWKRVTFLFKFEPLIVSIRLLANFSHPFSLFSYVIGVTLGMAMSVW